MNKNFISTFQETAQSIKNNLLSFSTVFTCVGRESLIKK